VSGAGEAELSSAFVAAQVLAPRKDLPLTVVAFVETVASSPYSKKRRVLIFVIIGLSRSLRKDTFASRYA
jgi:hypothetical protein